MKPSEIYDKIVTLLNADQVEEIELAQAKLDNGTVIEADSFEAGQNVFIVTEDEKVPLPIGDYVLEDGKKLVVSEEGIIASIGLEDEEKEEAEEEKKEEMGEDKKDEDMEEEKEADLEDVIESVIGALSPAIDEIKEEMARLNDEVEEMKKHYGNEEEKKEEMSAQTELSEQPKAFKHSPEKETNKKALNLFAQNRSMNVRDRVLQKIINNIKN